MTYEKNIKDIIEKKCTKCHGSNSPAYEEYKKDREKYNKLELYPRLDTYEFLMTFVKGYDIGALAKRLDDGTGREDGKEGSMYKHLGDTDAERQKNLKLFKEWYCTWVPKATHEISAEINAEWVSYTLDGDLESAEKIESLEERLASIRKCITAPEK